MVCAGFYFLHVISVSLCSYLLYAAWATLVRCLSRCLFVRMDVATIVLIVIVVVIVVVDSSSR